MDEKRVEVLKEKQEELEFMEMMRTQIKKEEQALTFLAFFFFLTGHRFDAI